MGKIFEGGVFPASDCTVFICLQLAALIDVWINVNVTPVISFILELYPYGARVWSTIATEEECKNRIVRKIKRLKDYLSITVKLLTAV